jgi:hypothetical protein
MAYRVRTQFSLVSDEAAWVIPAEADAVLKVEELLAGRTDWVELLAADGTVLFDSRTGVDKLWIRHRPFRPEVRSRLSPLAERLSGVDS